jgi:hypothetical protein
MGTGIGGDQEDSMRRIRSLVKEEKGQGLISSQTPQAGK